MKNMTSTFKSIWISRNNKIFEHIHPTFQGWKNIFLMELKLLKHRMRPKHANQFNSWLALQGQLHFSVLAAPSCLVSSFSLSSSLSLSLFLVTPSFFSFFSFLFVLLLFFSLFFLRGSSQALVVLFFFPCTAGPCLVIYKNCSGVFCPTVYSQKITSRFGLIGIWISPI